MSFYISYIYKPATSSHAKPGLFETTTLTLLLASSWISPFRKSSLAVTPELVLHHTPEFHRFPKFVASQIRDSEPSHVRDSEASRVQDSRPPCVRDSETSWVSDSRSSRVRDSETSWVSDSRSSRVLFSWKLTSQISLTSTFRGWQVFLNSPTLAPQASGLTPTIQFHEKFQNFSKNVTLEMSEGTRVTRKPRNGRIKARSHNYPPSPL
jgi:hypothetical protein